MSDGDGFTLVESKRSNRSRMKGASQKMTEKNSSPGSSEDVTRPSQKTETTGTQKVLIGTHDGNFHCDEALACFMLQQLPEYKDAQIIRTRDPAKLDLCDVVVDVGGVYDDSKKKYDHHQSGFTETMNSLFYSHPRKRPPAYPWTTKLSSAGLVYFHYGHRVLAEIMGRRNETEHLDDVYRKVYENFLEAIDSVDNLKLFPAPPRFRVKTALGSRVANLVPAWNEHVNYDIVMNQFKKAIELTGREFVEKITYYSEARRQQTTEASGMPRVESQTPRSAPNVEETKARTERLKTIGTHDGKLRCSEAFACCMLKQVTEYEDAEIIRSTDATVLDTCDAKVGVDGFLFKTQNLQYKCCGFNETMATMRSSRGDTDNNPRRTPLSSAGLVYFHHGYEVLAKIMRKDQSDDLVDAIYTKVYEDFVEAIDADANGYGIFEKKPENAYILTTDLCSRVTDLSANDRKTGDGDASRGHFSKAMNMAGSEFVEMVKYYSDIWWPAKKEVETAINERHTIHESGKVIKLKTCCPWKDHLRKLTADQETCVHFVLSCDQLFFRGEQWSIQSVNIKPRILLPELWRGKTGKDLFDVSGIEGCTYAHATGYIGGGSSYEVVLEMARKALETTE